MRTFLKTFLQTGLPFGFFMGLFFSLYYSWERGFASGLSAGVMFGLIMALFVKYQSRKFTSSRPLLPGEKLIKEGVANHFFNREAVGGWIYLTDSRFFFKSHKTNLQNHEFIVPNSDIAGVEKANTFGIIPNQLRLKLKSGEIEKFVVNNAKSWVKEIQHQSRV